MKRLLILLSFAFSSCAGSYYLLPVDELREIPVGSKKIEIAVPYDQEKLLTHLAKHFSREGFQVQTDKVAMQTSTGFKSIEGGATVRMIAAIDTIENGSRAIISGEWGLNNDGQLMATAFGGAPALNSANSIVYEGNIGTTKPGIAFQYMLITAKSIPAGTINYKR